MVQCLGMVFVFFVVFRLLKVDRSLLVILAGVWLGVVFFL